MPPPRPPRDPQRGNSLLLALIVMSALATLGSLTVVSMQSNIQMSTTNRAQQIALYAAESGAAVAMEFLRRTFDGSDPGAHFATSWSTYLSANNAAPPLMSGVIPSSDALPTDRTNNLFSVDQQAWFHIDLLNNRDDPGFATAPPTSDTDGIVIIRSTGHGPQGSLAIVEWEVQRIGFWGSTSPPPPGTPPPTPAPADFRLPITGVGGPTFPWIDARWTPFPFPTFGTTPAPFQGFGLVLLGWSIVSL
ncbi:MAG TPA: hypothetical protein VHW23_34150 [Kofleriaceae bacterium]|jgi:hypothetical protein|nr:hypothetical protein [Kofleriaceae bacterium]